jgi:hypothetical protein
MDRQHNSIKGDAMNYRAQCAISHAVFEDGFRNGAEGTAAKSAREVSELHPSWDDMMGTVYLNGAEDGARGDTFRRDLDCGLCGIGAVPYVEVDRETVVDHTTRLSFSIRVF